MTEQTLTISTGGAGITGTTNPTHSTNNPPPKVGAGTSNVFTPDQLRSIADDLVSKGQITREDADRQIAEQINGKPEAAPPPVAVEPHRYQLPPIDLSDGLTEAESMQFSHTARGWLVAGQFEQNIGSSLAKYAGEATTRYQAMSPAERELQSRKSTVALQKAYGLQTGDKLARGARFIDMVEKTNPGFKQFLAAGAIDDPRVVNILVTQAERLGL